MATQIPNILTLILVTLLCAVVNLSALEVAVDSDLDWNREFRAAGAANLIAGVGGGPPGCMNVTASALARKLGADTRLTGIVVALVVGSPLLLGDKILKLIPVPLVGGLLLFIGAGMLHEWLVNSRKRLPWTDYVILLSIFFTIVFFGFVEGIGVGVAITTVFFAVRLARVESVEAEFTARERHSNRSRPIADRAILLAEGERVRAYRLRGYLFFGSAHALGQPPQAVAARRPAPRLHSAGFRRRHWCGLLGYQHPVPIHPCLAPRQSAGGSQRGARQLQERGWNAIFPFRYTAPSCSKRTLTAPWSDARTSSSRHGGRISAAREAPATCC